jgi:hypothetical protein
LEAIETAEEIQNAVKVLAPMHVSTTDIFAADRMADVSQLLVNFVSNGKTPWYPPATLAQWVVKASIQRHKLSPPGSQH